MVNTPYGGKLIKRILSEEQIKEVLDQILRKVRINNDLVKEVKSILEGGENKSSALRKLGIGVKV